MFGKKIISVQFVLTALCVQFFVSIGADFSYAEQHLWKEKFHHCGGENQCPVDIKREHVVKMDLKPLVLCPNDFHFSKMKIENTGHSVQLSIVDVNEKLTISGGPYGNENYQLKQIHFHWGEHNEKGSETSIDGVHTDFETHFVFFKTSLGSFDDAAKSSDPHALAVVAVLIEIDKDTAKHHEHYPTFFMFTNDLHKVEKKTQHIVDDFKAIKFEELLPKTGYFTFRGSLTTPPCTENALWLVFEQPLKIPPHHLEHFRKIHDSKGNPMTYNRRIRQPLGNRKIAYVSKKNSLRSLMTKTIAGAISQCIQM